MALTSEERAGLDGLTLAQYADLCTEAHFDVDRIERRGLDPSEARRRLKGYREALAFKMVEVEQRTVVHLSIVWQLMDGDRGLFVYPVVGPARGER